MARQLKDMKSLKESRNAPAKGEGTSKVVMTSNKVMANAFDPQLKIKR